MVSWSTLTGKQKDVVRIFAQNPDGCWIVSCFDCPFQVSTSNGHKCMISKSRSSEGVADRCRELLSEEAKLIIEG